jgi:hypothetical protein
VFTSLLARIAALSGLVLVALAVPSAAYAGPAPVVPDTAAGTAPVIIQSTPLEAASTVSLLAVAVVSFAAALVAAALVAVTTSMTTRRSHRRMSAPQLT